MTEIFHLTQRDMIISSCYIQDIPLLYTADCTAWRRKGGTGDGGRVLLKLPFQQTAARRDRRTQSDAGTGLLLAKKQQARLFPPRCSIAAPRSSSWDPAGMKLAVMCLCVVHLIAVGAGQSSGGDPRLGRSSVSVSRAKAPQKTRPLSAGDFRLEYFDSVNKKA